jgi:hypothetical protein
VRSTTKASPAPSVCSTDVSRGVEISYDSHYERKKDAKPPFSKHNSLSPTLMKWFISKIIDKSHFHHKIGSTGEPNRTTTFHNQSRDPITQITREFSPN